MRHTKNQDEQEDTVDACSKVAGREIWLCSVFLAAVQKAG